MSVEMAISVACVASKVELWLYKISSQLQHTATLDVHCIPKTGVFPVKAFQIKKT